ncbi:tripartite tricarboxylate transporter substrate-binding protein [Ramlibacter sp. AN1015]|uniref:Bug family tripartite tricarboxylate transporter substrate binding protein n=1 Tax=Ramlibacter sp. AN1015 TaxID=3133428 RepID=UPI0030BBFBD0
MNTKSATVRALLTVALCGGLSTPHAQSPAESRFPTKPITMVVTLPAGSVTDTVARVISAQLAERLEQPVVVLNKPGASSGVAMAALSQAPADGHTLMFGASNMVGQAATNAKFEEAVRKDLVPVAEVVRGPLS